MLVEFGIFTWTEFHLHQSVESPVRSQALRAACERPARVWGSSCALLFFLVCREASWGHNCYGEVEGNLKTVPYS